MFLLVRADSRDLCLYEEISPFRFSSSDVKTPVGMTWTDSATGGLILHNTGGQPGSRLFENLAGDKEINSLRDGFEEMAYCRIRT